MSLMLGITNGYKSTFYILHDAGVLQSDSFSCHALGHNLYFAELLSADLCFISFVLATAKHHLRQPSSRHLVKRDGVSLRQPL